MEMDILKIKVLLVCVFVSAACAAPPSTEVAQLPLPQTTSMESFSPTQIPTVTSTPSPTPLPWPDQAITMNNLPDLVEFRNYGQGSLQDLSVAEGSNRALLQTTKAIILYDLEEQQIIAEMDLPYYYMVSFEANLLALVDAEGVLTLHSLDDLEELLVLETGELASNIVLRFSPDFSLLAVARFSPTRDTWPQQVSAAERVIRVYEVMTGDLVFTLDHGDFAPPPESIRISPDNKYLISKGSTAYFDQLAVWDLQSQELINRTTGNAIMLDAPFSPDGARFVTVLDNNLVLWDSAKGETLANYGTGLGGTWDAAWSIDGAFIRLNYGDQVRRADTGALVSAEQAASIEFPSVSDTWELRSSLTREFYGKGYANVPASSQIYFSPEVASASIWLLSESESYDFDKQEYSLTATSLSIWTLEEGALDDFSSSLGAPTALSVAAGRLVTCLEGQLVLYDVIGGSTSTPFGACDNRSQLALSPSGDTVAVANKKVIDVYEVNGETIGTLRAHQYDVSAMAFTPDGQNLATFGDQRAAGGFHWSGGELFIWDLQEPIHRSHNLTGMTEQLRNLTFSNSADYIFASEGDSVRVWRLADSQQLNNLKNPAYISALEVPASDSFIAVAGSDGQIHFWDFVGHELLYSLQAHSAGVARMFEGYGLYNVTLPVIDLEFVKEDHALYSVSADGTAKLWGIK